MTRTLSLLLVFGIASGCAVKTKQTTYVDPDAYGAVEGTGIEARDVRTVVQDMSRGILSAQVITDFNGTPRIAVVDVKNRSRFLIDQGIFTTQITDILVQNAAGKLAVLNRDITEEIMAERERKRTGEADAYELTSMAGADFFLSGEVQSLSASDGANQSDYVVIRFQLTDAETGVVGWSNSFEMKKEGSWGVMYQ